MIGTKLVVPVALLALAGCATPRVEQLRDSASGLYASRSAVSAAVAAADRGRGAPDALLKDLLARPVDADAAVQIALLRNPRVAAIYARLGFVRADLYDAFRLSNPTLGYARLSGGAGARKVDWSLSQNFTEILFARFRKAGGESRVLLAEQQVARELLDLEADVRTSQIRYVGSRTVASMRDRIARSTQVAANYAQQLFDAGNITALQLARMREAEDLARTEMLRAHAAETADRNALLTLLGAGSDESIDLVGEFLPPMADIPDGGKLREVALGNRLDLMSAREALRFASVANRHARRWRWLGETTIGMGVEQDGGNRAVASATIAGPGASLSLPLFNQGDGSAGRAQATVDVLAADVHALELAIGNEVATRLATLAAAREAVTIYRDQLLPVQRTIVDESQKQQNYMLIGTIELLAAKQHQYEGYQAYVDALRDYWSAYVGLMRATGGRFPGLAGRTDRATAIEPLAAIEMIPGAHP